MGFLFYNQGEKNKKKIRRGATLREKQQKGGIDGEKRKTARRERSAAAGPPAQSTPDGGKTLRERHCRGEMNRK